MSENKRTPENTVFNEYLQFSIHTARSAGDILMKQRGNVDNISKDPKNLITAADLESNQFIVNAIRGLYPTHRILSEEAGLDNETESDFEWVIDPLDGTNNFSRGDDNFSVAMALRHKGLGVVGVVFAPAKNRLYQGMLGNGAYCEDSEGKRKIGVSNKERSHEMFTMSFSVGIDLRNEKLCDEFVNTIRSAPDFVNVRRRMLESSELELCGVADGRLDAHFNNIGKPWDVAAGEVIVREAGGLVTNLNDKIILASNGYYHDALLNYAGPLFPEIPSDH